MGRAPPGGPIRMPSVDDCLHMDAGRRLVDVRERANRWDFLHHVEQRSSVRLKGRVERWRHRALDQVPREFDRPICAIRCVWGGAGCIGNTLVELNISLRTISETYSPQKWVDHGKSID